MIFDQTQVDAIQRVLKLNLSWMVQNASILFKIFDDNKILGAHAVARALHAP